MLTSAQIKRQRIINENAARMASAAGRRRNHLQLSANCYSAVLSHPGLPDVVVKFYIDTKGDENEVIASTRRMQSKRMHYTNAYLDGRRDHIAFEEWDT